MYRKQDKAQLTMDEFYIPFGDGLSADNRWIKIAKLIPSKAFAICTLMCYDDSRKQIQRTAKSRRIYG